MKMFRKEEGFTLVELMVVVLIIGILVAIAIPVFNAAKANAQKKSCFANQRTLEGSAQTYQGEFGNLPPAGGVNAWAVPTYVKTAPFCPADTAKAEYTMTTAGTVDNCTVTTPNHGHF
jgi:prepilin-type N-terminal cleavage/methylation domain-containing protein